MTERPEPHSRMEVILVHPEIPPNTGNVARTCAATESHLHLVEPLGFEVSDKTLKRAGMDYWKDLSWSLWPDWSAFAQSKSESTRFWFIESDGPTRYDTVQYQPGDCLVFGCETKGLPVELYKKNPNQWVRLPMIHPTARSLNLSNSVAIVLFEALRQQGFHNERPIKGAAAC